MAGINNLLWRGNEILNHEGCNNHEWKTQEGDLLQTLKFYNANLAPPFPTIYGWIGYLGNQWLWPSCALNPESWWMWQNYLFFFFFFQNFLFNLPTPTCYPEPFGENSQIKTCWFPGTVSHLNNFQWPDPSCWSRNLINHSFWEWRCPLFIHTESNCEVFSSKQTRVREPLGALRAQSIPSRVTWMKWR